MQSRYKSTRSVIALLLVAVMIIGFSATLYKIQVQDHEYYAAQNNTVKTYKVAVEEKYRFFSFGDAMFIE